MIDVFRRLNSSCASIISAVVRQDDSIILNRDSHPRSTALHGPHGERRRAELRTRLELSALESRSARISPNGLLVRTWRSLIELRLDDALATVAQFGSDRARQRPGCAAIAGVCRGSASRAARAEEPGRRHGTRCTCRTRTSSPIRWEESRAGGGAARRLLEGARLGSILHRASLWKRGRRLISARTDLRRSSGRRSKPSWRPNSSDWPSRRDSPGALTNAP